MEKTIFIYYYPFELETFSPISEKDIESVARCTLHIPREHRLVKELFSIFEKVEAGEFDSRVVRMKIKSPRSVISYVDQDGGLKSVVKSGTSDAKLTAEGFRLLKVWAGQAIEKFNGCSSSEN
ncbi:MAG: hypothetical protein WC953_03695 [Pseudomonas sp.]